MIECGGVSEHVLNVVFGDPTIGASDQGKSSGFVKLVQIIACPLRRQAIVWTNAIIMSIRPQGA